MNTASRLDHALPSYELLMTDSTARAGELTTWLEQKNTERQQITAKATTVAREQVLTAKLESLIMVRVDDFSAGISGLVANKLSVNFTVRLWLSGPVRK